MTIFMPWVRIDPSPINRRCRANNRSSELHWSSKRFHDVPKEPARFRRLKNSHRPSSRIDLPENFQSSSEIPLTRFTVDEQSAAGSINPRALKILGSGSIRSARKLEQPCHVNRPMRIGKESFLVRWRRDSTNGEEQANFIGRV